MDKITKEQFERAEGKVRGLSSIFRQALDDVLVDEGLLVKKEEWQIKTLPNAYIICCLGNPEVIRSLE